MTDLEELESKQISLDNAFWKLMNILNDKGQITGKEFNDVLFEADI